MTDVTQILSQIEQGDPSAAEQLLPLLYEELRKLATAKLANEKPGQTLQATALVHDAYIRLVDVEKAQRWDSRGHFFAAAAEAMRRILIENVRRKRAEKRGGKMIRRELDDAQIEVIPTGTHTAKTDILLDRGVSHFVEDRLDTCHLLEAAGITPILFQQPWNRAPHDYIEVSNWGELEALIDFDMK